MYQVINRQLTPTPLWGGADFSIGPTINWGKGFFGMAILTVGPTEQFSSIADAVSAAQGGDTIAIDAGHYAAQDIMLTKDLTITAAGDGPVVLQGDGPLHKGMFISGSSATAPNVTIQGLTFQNARSPDENGAGIRYQSGNLTLVDDTFRNNQDGLLATPFRHDTGTIIVQGSTFDHNGVATGLGHNLYINRVADFVMTNSVSENAVVGHEIKSRAFNNDIENNLIADGPSGTSSYSIDIPNGGNTIIQGNTIEQGPNSRNPWMIAFGEEGARNPGSLTVSGNLLLNDLSNGRGVWNASHTAASVADNQTWGFADASILRGLGTVLGDTSLIAEPALGSLAIPTSTGGTSGEGPNGTTGGTNGTNPGLSVGLRQPTGISFVGGSSGMAISANGGTADLPLPVLNAGTGVQSDPTQSHGVAPSDFTAGSGAEPILQGATTAPSNAGSFGWLPNQPSTAQLFATSSS